MADSLEPTVQQTTIPRLVPMALPMDTIDRMCSTYGTRLAAFRADPTAANLAALEAAAHAVQRGSHVARMVQQILEDAVWYCQHKPSGHVAEIVTMLELCTEAAVWTHYLNLNQRNFYRNFPRDGPLSPQVFQKVLEHASKLGPHALMAFAEHDDAPAELLSLCAHHKCFGARAAAARHPNTPVQILERLAAGPEVRIAWDAKTTLLRHHSRP